jgi:hypothetical protein
MIAAATGFVDLALALIAPVVILSTVLGAIDLVRQPGWAWRAAGEPKLLSLMLVLLLPGVGLAIYVFGARPKVLAIATAGRAANLPFERFGDRQTLATENTRSIQALALPTTLGSFGEPRTTPAVKTSSPTIGGPTIGGPTRGGFLEDPDVVTVGGTTETLEPAASAAPQTAAVVEPTIHIPGSLGRPYHPRQRTSLTDGDSLASVAAQILGATQEQGAHAPAPDPTLAAPTPPTFGAVPAPAGAVPAESAPAAQVAGPTFAAAAPTHGFGNRTAAHGSSVHTATQLAAAPVATRKTPEIFRPRPDTVAPLQTAAPTAVATMAPVATMAARWLPDPTGRHQYRYWDGGVWTENVYDAGVESRDAVVD